MMTTRFKGRTIEVHSQKHDKIPHGKLHHIQKASNDMLPQPELRPVINMRCSGPDNGSILSWPGVVEVIAGSTAAVPTTPNAR